MTTLRWATPLVLAAAVLTGCQHSTPTASSTSAVEAPPVQPVQVDTLQKLGYTQRWVTDLTIRPNEWISQITLLNDQLIVIQQPSNLVRAVSVRDGSTLWRNVVGEATDELYEPVRIGNRIYINTGHRVYAIAADTGTKLSIGDLQSSVADGPAVSGLNLIFGSLTGKIFAHSTVTGHSAWVMSTPEGILVRPVVDGNDVFVADRAGNYKMLSTTGELLWYGRALAQISAKPILNANGVFVASDDQTFRALNRINGKDRWTYRATAALRGSPTALGGTLYLPLPTGELAAIDPLNGAELWKLPGKPTPLLLNDQKLLLYTSASLLLVDNQSSKTLMQVPIAPVQKVMVGPDNSLILIAADGQVQRLDKGQ
ncbi:MAG: PQQ-like beta-propeller repeat protein [Phycisphaeraceae bacterium]|nr:PQQ-like beta-propeller repeat protein [Phycisphaeraceae bacterium]